MTGEPFMERLDVIVDGKKETRHIDYRQPDKIGMMISYPKLFDNEEMHRTIGGEIHITTTHTEVEERDAPDDDPCPECGTQLSHEWSGVKCPNKKCGYWFCL